MAIGDTDYGTGSSVGGTTGGNADAGVGGGIGIAPDYGTQQRMGGITKSVKKVAGALGSGGGGVGAQGVGGSMGSFPVPAPRANNPKNPNLWMGSESPIAFMDLSDAQQMYFMWDPKTKNKFLSQLQLAGYNVSKIQDSQLAKLWGDYVTTAAQYQQAGKRISPWDVLGKDIAQQSEAASQPRTVTQSQKTYNISTAEDAAALFQGAAQTLLGRDPTKSEQNRFKSILNKYEQAHPATATTTSTYVGQDMTGQVSKSEGGVTAGAQQYIAQEEAKKNPEYGAYQAATNGMNWLMEMLGG